MSACWSMMRYKLLLRVLFITMFGIICFAQCYSILKSFLGYPRIINIYDESPDLISILPGLTICNNNRISLKKLVARNATLRELFNQKFPGWLQPNGQIKPLVNKVKFNEFRDELARIFEQHHHHHHKETKNITIDSWFNYRPEDTPFIDWFGCARTWQNSIDCGNLTRIESMSNRRCTTLLHRGAMLYDVYNRPELFNITNDNIDSLNYFDAKEVIKIVLNFEPEDYGDLKRQIGARLTFHDSNMVASQGDLDYFVTRGYRYDFSIDRKDIKFSNGPHDRCLEYDKINLEKYKFRVEPRVPLAAHTCFQNCIIRNIIHNSDCWAPSMPYFRNDSLDPELSLKECSWFKRSHHASLFYELMRVDNVRARKRKEQQQMQGNATTYTTTTTTTTTTTSPLNSTEYEVLGSLLPYLKASSQSQLPKSRVRERMRKYRKTRRFCLTQCRLSCKITTYAVTVTKSAWPSDVKILFDPTGKERLRRHCCALIAVKFTHFHYNIHEYRPKYDVSNTVGDLGGLLAFWMGLSIVSIYHAVHKLLALFSRRSMNKIHYLTSSGT